MSFTVKAVIASSFLASSFLASSFITSQAFAMAHDHNLCHGFVDDATEEQGVSPEEQAFIGGGISKEDFDSVIDEHKAKYDKDGIIQSFNASWTIAKLWTNNTKNANASKRGSKWHINMYGGLARHHTVTKDGFALVLCHETGHLLAGFPAYGSTSDRGRMMGDEGNSDYYATFACANFLWGEQDEINAKAREAVKPAAQEFCDKVYPDDEKAQNLCYRSVNGAEGLAQFLNGDREVFFDKPDTNKVASTSHRHPKGQCRLDTYMAGAACKKYAEWQHKQYPTNEQEMFKQSCSGEYPADANVIKEQGFRPRCWFAPKVSKIETKKKDRRKKRCRRGKTRCKQKKKRTRRGRVPTQVI